MHRIASIVAGLSLAFVGTSTTIAATINVPGDQPTIAAAISASVNGDVINIAAGTYNEYNLNPDGKAITIGSASGYLDVTINGQGGSVFVFNSGETSGTVIRNLTMTGGTGTQSNGGGIYCVNSSPTITECTISDNSANNGGGGGIYCENSNPTISSCTITGNYVNLGNGGGIYCSSSSPTITGCLIGNEAGSGGGIYCYDNSSPTITECTFYGNECRTGNGGGIYCASSNPTISGCTITGNSAEHGGGIYSYESNPHLIGCSFSDNTNIAGDTSNISGTVTQSLRGEQIDLGRIILEDSTVCGTGEYNITGVLIEHRGKNHISDCIDEGDLNGDGAIDSTDLDAMHAAVGICTSDVNHDGDTNVLDLLGVIDEWGGVCP